MLGFSCLSIALGPRDSVTHQLIVREQRLDVFLQALDLTRGCNLAACQLGQFGVDVRDLIVGIVGRRLCKLDIYHQPAIVNAFVCHVGRELVIGQRLRRLRRQSLDLDVAQTVVVHLLQEISVVPEFHLAGLFYKHRDTELADEFLAALILLRRKAEAATKIIEPRRQRSRAGLRRRAIPRIDGGPGECRVPAQDVPRDQPLERGVMCMDRSVRATVQVRADLFRQRIRRRP